MKTDVTINELCRIIEEIHNYCEGMIVWGNNDRERWEHVSRLAKYAIEKSKERRCEASRVQMLFKEEEEENANENKP